MKNMIGLPPGTTTTFLPETLMPRLSEMYSAIASRKSGNPGVGPYPVHPSSSAFFAASFTCCGVGKSGWPISRWTIFFPCASSARARCSTSNADSIPIRDMLSASFMTLH